MKSNTIRRFDADTTAAEILDGVDLSGKFAVITGGGGGLGLETARALLAAGADVCIGGRTRSKVNQTADVLSKQYPLSKISSYHLDLASLESVDAFSDKVIGEGRSIDLLIANAGIMACPLARNDLGLELQFATNFVGHALLISRLSSSIRKNADSRVICLSSSGHHFSPVVLDDLNFEKRPYDKWSAYGQSKTACALLARKVHAELSNEGVTGLAVHPGVIGTDLMRHLSKDDYAAIRQRSDMSATNAHKRKTVEQGSATTVWAATAPQLKGTFAYLEDCQIAAPTAEADTVSGVMAFAVDQDIANQLWIITERTIGRSLTL